MYTLHSLCATLYDCFMKCTCGFVYMQSYYITHICIFYAHIISYTIYSYIMIHYISYTIRTHYVHMYSVRSQPRLTQYVIRFMREQLRSVVYAYTYVIYLLYSHVLLSYLYDPHIYSEGCIIERTL